MEHPAALNDDFNLSTAASTTVLELAELIWRKVNGTEPFRYVSDDPFEYDVQRGCPPSTRPRRSSASRPRRRLDDMLDEVIPWIVEAVNEGRL